MKVALVTGVSSGIGRATAVRLAQIGYRTFGTVREAVAPHENIELVRVDVRDRDSVEEAVASVFEGAGRIDVLVNSAGVAMVSAVECNHIGRLGDYVEEAAAKGYIGILTSGGNAEELATAAPFGVYRSSGSSVRFPTMTV